MSIKDLFAKILDLNEEEYELYNFHASKDNHGLVHVMFHIKSDVISDMVSENRNKIPNQMLHISAASLGDEDKW